MPDVPLPGLTPDPDPAATVAALAGQVERLRATVENADLHGLRSRTDALATDLLLLASRVTDLAAALRSAEQPVPSWLAGTGYGGTRLTCDSATTLLDELTGWLARMYVPFPDGVLPDCWLWHPDVVEELLWLREAWWAAYRGPGASAQRAGDWHERHRPGVCRRIRSSAGDCSLHAHLDPVRAARVPGPDAAASIAAWRTATDATAPVPTEEQIRAADGIQATGRRP